MTVMSLVPLHVVGGAIAIVSGLIALYAFKRAALHRRSGTIFVYAMLVMSLSGALMAIGHVGAAVNIPAGLVTAYLVITSLATVRPPSEAWRRVNSGAMYAGFILGGSSLMVAASGGHGALTPPLVMFGLVALLGSVGDVRMIRAGGLHGKARIRRHLWRMSAALFVASASFFLGPVRRIPEPLRIPALRLIPLLVLVTMAYWLWRYRRTSISRAAVGVTAPEAI
jgi:hypothetical protein